MDERTQPIYGAPLREPQFAVNPAGAGTHHAGRTLVAVAGPMAGHVFILAQVEETIGRDERCTVALCCDPTVSRLHARITRGADGHTIADDDSVNGTFVNGVAINTCALAVGDTIQCGSVQLRYQ